MPRDELFRSPYIAVRDRTHNLCDLMRRKIDLHDCAGLRDMDVRGRMIECVNPDLESLLANQRGHPRMIPKALG